MNTTFTGHTSCDGDGRIGLMFTRREGKMVLLRTLIFLSLKEQWGWIKETPTASLATYVAGSGASVVFLERGSGGSKSRVGRW